MKTVLAESFIESLEKITRREKWYWKCWNFVRYDFPCFIKNVWTFRKALFKYKWWDQFGLFLLMKTALEEKAQIFEKRGLEVPESRNKRVAQMRRAVEIIDVFLKEEFQEMAERELGILHSDLGIDFQMIPGTNSFEIVENRTSEDIESDRKIRERAKEIEDELWVELWEIFKGQNIEEYRELLEKTEDGKKGEVWDIWYKGGDLRSWWD